MRKQRQEEKQGLKQWQESHFPRVAIQKKSRKGRGVEKKLSKPSLFIMRNEGKGDGEAFLFCFLNNF